MLSSPNDNPDTYNNLDSSMTSDLTTRMKSYESLTKAFLPRHSWSIIRLDGRSFHFWTLGLERPFSELLARAIDHTAKSSAKRSTELSSPTPSRTR